MLPDAVELRRQIHHHPELGLELPRDAGRGARRARRPRPRRAGTGDDGVVGRGRPAGCRRRSGRSCCAPTWTRCRCRKTPGSNSRARSTARCTRADTTRTSRCSSARHASCASGATELAGTVRFMFQPGEEGFHGARYMIDEACSTTPDVDAAFALHVSPNLPSGSIWTRGGRADGVGRRASTITVTGKGGHASTPYLANDPMPVAAEIVQALQVMVDAAHQHVRSGRHHDHEDPRRHDDQRDPRDGATCWARCARCRSTVARVGDRGDRAARHAAIADAHEMHADVDRRTRLSGDGQRRRRSPASRSRSAGELLGAERARSTCRRRSMGAEDFSYVLQQRPGALAFLGVCPPGEHPPACARVPLEPHDDRRGRRCSAGIAMHAAMAIDVPRRSARERRRAVTSPPLRGG